MITIRPIGLGYQDTARQTIRIYLDRETDSSFIGQIEWQRERLERCEVTFPKYAWEKAE